MNRGYCSLAVPTTTLLFIFFFWMTKLNGQIDGTLFGLTNQKYENAKKQQQAIEHRIPAFLSLSVCHFLSHSVHVWLWLWWLMWNVNHIYKFPIFAAFTTFAGNAYRFGLPFSNAPNSMVCCAVLSGCVWADAKNVSCGCYRFFSFILVNCRV